MTDPRPGMSMDLARASDKVKDAFETLRNYTLRTEVVERYELEGDARMLERMASRASGISTAARLLAKRFKAEKKARDRADRIAADKMEKPR